MGIKTARRGRQRSRWRATSGEEQRELRVRGGSACQRNDPSRQPFPDQSGHENIRVMSDALSAIPVHENAGAMSDTRDVMLTYETVPTMPVATNETSPGNTHETGSICARLLMYNPPQMSHHETGVMGEDDYPRDLQNESH